MARSSLWSEVEALVEKGERPIIKLSKGQKVIERRPPGRPRTKPLNAHDHYNWKMKTPAGVAMRCRNHGCQRKLPSKTEALTCSKACELELTRYCEETLAVIRGEKRARDYPPDLRGQKNSMARRKAA